MSLYEFSSLSQLAVCTTMIQQIHLIHTISYHHNSSELNRTFSVKFSFTGSSMLKSLCSYTVTQYIILEWLKYFQALQRHILYPYRTRQMISNLCEPGFSRPDLQWGLRSGCDGLAFMTEAIKICPELLSLIWNSVSDEQKRRAWSRQKHSIIL